MKILRGFVISLALLACAPPHPSARPAPTGSAQFEPEIQKFEVSDREHPPAPGAVLFVGSSSIERWQTLGADFPDTRVINRGVGSFQLEDLLYFADRVVISYRPRLILVYAGDNDLSAGKSPDRVLSDYQTLVRRIEQKLPQTRIGFISIKPSPSRWTLAPRMREANRLVREFSARDPRLFFIDVFTPMLGPDGMPRPELFVEDMLHMNAKGYEIWKSVIAPYVEDRSAHAFKKTLSTRAYLAGPAPSSLRIRHTSRTVIVTSS